MEVCGIKMCEGERLDKVMGSYLLLYFSDSVLGLITMSH